MGHKMVLEVSLSKYVNILYQISRNRKCNCNFNVLVCIVRLVVTSFLYQLKTLLFSSQSGAKWKNFKLRMFSDHLLVYSWC